MTAASSCAPTLGIVRLEHAGDLELPSYETSGSAGMDLRAAVAEDRQIVLLPGRRTLVPTGLIFEIPEGFEVQIRPRSGLAFKSGITCLNTPGTIDSDYRGEVKVLLVNLGDDDFRIERGMRIAQAVLRRLSSRRSRNARKRAKRRAARAGSARPAPPERPESKATCASAKARPCRAFA